ncbi:MAG TPA: DUF3307 domain-containing protein [Candidatus Limnocylindrales bacterium]|nr:DUF3307 domain-containing protein [Candidatus Limnocylindrales bacterium]
MADPTLSLAWLVLAHLVADFVLQTRSIVTDKFTLGWRGWRGLLAHGAAVAFCLIPFAVAFEGPGVALLVVVAAGHVLIDRWKVRATRHAEAEALAAAHRRHEGPTTAGLGPAWTPLPGALFALDQLAHVILMFLAWAVLVAGRAPGGAFVAAVDRAIGTADRVAFHHGALVAVVLVALAIVNVRGAALFVATLVRPREAVTGTDLRDGEPAATATTGPRTWRVRLGGFVATAEPVAPPAPSVVPDPPSDRASPSQIGATIGVLERLLIVVLVMSGATAAIGFVVAAKTLARFRQLDDRDFAEYYLLGTLASVGVALASGVVAAAALATLR